MRVQSLPFYDDSLNGGWMRMDGILRVEEDFLYFDFQKKDNALGAFQSELKTIKIPVAEISLAEFKKGWFVSKLIIHASLASTFNELPGKELTKRILKIKKEYRPIAVNVSSNLNLKISENRLKELDE